MDAPAASEGAAVDTAKVVRDVFQNHLLQERGLGASETSGVIQPQLTGSIIGNRLPGLGLAHLVYG